MKLIVTHKKQLVRSSDVSRFIAYIYGKNGERPVVPVEGFMPGLPTGDPFLDTEALLSSHHGGKAAKARSIVISSHYFSDQETAMLNAPAMSRVAAAFRLAQAPNVNAVSVVHLTMGEGRFDGMWRLDAHLLLCNSDGRRGIQWSRQECSAIQDLKWIPESVRNHFNISPGKGTGVTRTQKIAYPKSKNLVSYEIGTLTDIEIEQGISQGLYGEPRRAKNGRIISLEAHGKRININRARHLVDVRNHSAGTRRLLPTGSTEATLSAGKHSRPGINPDTTILVPATRTTINMGGGNKGRGKNSYRTDFICERRRRLSGRCSSKSEARARTPGFSTPVVGSAQPALARDGQARAILIQGKAAIRRISKVLAEMEGISFVR